MVTVVSSHADLRLTEEPLILGVMEGKNTYTYIDGHLTVVWCSIMS